MSPLPAIRAAEYERITALLAAHRAAFEEIIALATQPVDHIAANIFARLADKARSGISALEFTAANPEYGQFGSLGHWGGNGRGPAVADLLRQDRYHVGCIGFEREASGLIHCGEDRRAA